MNGLRPDDLIRRQEERRRDREAEGLRGLEVDDQVKLRRLLDGQVGGFSAFENAIDIDRGVSFAQAIEEIAQASGRSQFAEKVR